jgi:hypothetical protein
MVFGVDESPGLEDVAKRQSEELPKGKAVIRADVPSIVIAG